MNKKLKVWTILSGVFGLLFVLFTVLVKTIDVEVVGEAGSEVGFAFLNRPFTKAVGENGLWLKVSELFGIVALLIICLFVGIGLIQWIKRKSLKQVDYQIYALAVLCVCVALMYVLFEILVINKRPILISGNNTTRQNFNQNDSKQKAETEQVLKEKNYQKMLYYQRKN